LNPLECPLGSEGLASIETREFCWFSFEEEVIPGSVHGRRQKGIILR